MSSTRLALFVALSCLFACASQQPCPVCPVCPAAPTKQATPPSNVVARRPPPPVPPPTPPAPGVLPTVDLAEFEAAGVATCPSACSLDEETERTYDEARSNLMAVEGATDGPPAIASFHIVQPGGTLTVGRHERVDLLGMVVAGRANVALADNARGRQTLEPWTAFYLPEGGLTVQAEGDQPTLLALVRATGNPRDLRTLASSRARRRTRGGLVVRPLSDVADLAWSGGAFHARIAFEAPGSPHASLGVLLGSPSAVVADHGHESSWEILAVVSAAGALRVPGQPVPNGAEGARIAEHDRAVATGGIVLVPPGVRHEWRPYGGLPLVAVQAYAPPGPEQRFRALASGVAPAPAATPAPTPAATP